MSGHEFHGQDPGRGGEWSGSYDAEAGDDRNSDGPSTEQGRLRLSVDDASPDRVMVDKSSLPIDRAQPGDAV